MSAEWPPQDVIYRVLPLLARFLESIVWGNPGRSLRVSSWYRDVETNRRVGGAPDSQHLFGLAMDLVGEETELEQFARNLRAIGVVVVPYAGHLHVQLLPAGAARGYGLFA